jgi:Ni/Fe-hydrogenase subunit HybB-like protein
MGDPAPYDPTARPGDKSREGWSPLGYSARILGEGETHQSVTEKIAGIVLNRRHPTSWYVGVVIGFLLVLLLLYSIAYLFIKGVGIWGINIPVAWGFAIINFVWWVGIAHAGTFISAILLLLAQHWRNSINRFSEAMTLFAVCCAGLFPLLHLGRPWIFYWLLPYPNTMGLWPQFRSPLVWDVFAVGTYFTVSLLFWYLGLIPDLATLRDRSPLLSRKRLFGFFALGWRGSVSQWQSHQMAYLILAAVATPLVLSVHSVVSLDFAVSLLPGWHTTIFPPYFVAGAIFSGFAMVLTIIIPVRKLYKLESVITMAHINNMACVMLITGLMVGYGYIMEAFMAWYSGEPFERFLLQNRALGPYAPAYWALILCNIVIPQLLWSKRVRGHLLTLFIISIIVNIGMWLERFVIVVISLHRDFVPSSWGYYAPTFWDWATYLGTIGLFLFLLLLFIRSIPMISISEVKELVAKRGGDHDH